MNKNLKWKTILILVVIGLSVWSLWPPLSIKDKEGNHGEYGSIGQVHRW